MKTNMSLVMRFTYFFLVVFSFTGCRENSVDSLITKHGLSNARKAVIDEPASSINPQNFKVRQIFEDKQTYAKDNMQNVGGSEGLYVTESGSAFFSDMALAYDVASGGVSSGLITDTDGNYWRLYTPSTPTLTDFSNHTPSITIKKSIDWSKNTSPTRYSQKKLRFTND